MNYRRPDLRVVRTGEAAVPAHTASAEPGYGPAAVSRSGQAVLVPVAVTRPGHSRPIGAYEIGPDRARFRPVFDVRGIALAAAGLGAVAVAAGTALALRRARPAVGPVNMGPGGWLSVRAGTMPPRYATGRRVGRPRPLWARLLRARPFPLRTVDRVVRLGPYGEQP